jgi:hypothetical protein
MATFLKGGLNDYVVIQYHLFKAGFDWPFLCLVLQLWIRFLPAPPVVASTDQSLMAMFVNSGRVFYAAWSPGFVVQSTLLVRAEPFLIDRRPIPLSQHSALKTDDDKAAVVRNGYLSERSIQTGGGDMAVKSRRPKPIFRP